MSENLATYHERLQACEEQYVLHFAGQVRVTRDPSMLDTLIREVEKVEAEAKTHDSDSAVHLAETAAAQAATYRAERAHIVAACDKAGTTGRAAALLARRASLVMHRYSRHFAGQSRPSRDVGMLREMRADLAHLARAMVGVANENAAYIEEFLELLAREQQAIEASRSEGTPAEQAAKWAGAANTLLTSYENHCLGRRMLAVRPDLITRLLSCLQTACDAMVALRTAGLNMRHHDAAIGHLQGQVRMWEQELTATAQAHDRADNAARLEALSAELDDVLAVFNESPGIVALRGLCDRTDEYDRALRQIGEDAGAVMVAGDALAMLCERFDAASDTAAPAQVSEPR